MNWILQQHQYNWSTESQFLNYLRIKLPIILSSGTTVTSVSNADGTLTVTPTTGDAVVSLNLAKANTWVGLQTGSFAGTLQGTFSNSTSSVGFIMGGIGFTPSGLANAIIMDGSGNLQMRRTDSSLVVATVTTTQKNAIPGVVGMIAFDTTLGKLCVRTAAAWQTITSV